MVYINWAKSILPKEYDIAEVQVVGQACMGKRFLECLHEEEGG